MTPPVTVRVGSQRVTVPYTITLGFEFAVMVANNDERKTTEGLDKQALHLKVAAVLGRSPGGLQKHFSGNTSGIWAAVDNHTRLCPDCTCPRPVYCIKAYTAADLNAWMATLTADVALVYDQEFYGADQAGWDNYNAHYKTIFQLVAAHPKGHHVEVQSVSSTSKERALPGGWPKFDARYAHSWGSDAYNARPDPILSGEQLYRDQVTAIERMRQVNPGLKWRISETGVSRLSDPQAGVLYTGARRIEIFQDQVDYVIGNGAASMGYWAVANPTAAEPVKDWSTDKGTPADLEFAAHLRALCDRYPVRANWRT